MPGNYLLATVHRASNTGTEENLQEICKAFIELAKEINPVGYLEMLIGAVARGEAFLPELARYLCEGRRYSPRACYEGKRAGATNITR